MAELDTFPRFSSTFTKMQTYEGSSRYSTGLGGLVSGEPQQGGFPPSRAITQSSFGRMLSDVTLSVSPVAKGTAYDMEEIKSEVKRIVPSLSQDSYKGMHGKVGVLGGCSEYHQAPYFVAMAALRVGADLAHVFTTKAVANTIKGLSSDIFVHPYFPETSDVTSGKLVLTDDNSSVTLIRECVESVVSWFARLDCLVIGPGLGRDPLLLDIARSCIIKARDVGLPLVIDGDGLFLVAREPDLVAGHTTCVLTPNLNEFRRLAATLGVSLHGPQAERVKKLAEVTRHLAGPAVVSKGPSDVLHDGRTAVVCSANAGLRRCGGQGDILSGSIATFLCWAQLFARRQSHQQTSSGSRDVGSTYSRGFSAQRSSSLGHGQSQGTSASDSTNDGALEMSPVVLAAFGGCLVTRTACCLAFSHKHRSMLATDVLDYLGRSFDDLFDHHHTVVAASSMTSISESRYKSG